MNSTSLVGFYITMRDTFLVRNLLLDYGILVSLVCLFLLTLIRLWHSRILGLWSLHGYGLINFRCFSYLFLELRIKVWACSLVEMIGTCFNFLSVPIQKFYREVLSRRLVANLFIDSYRGLHTECRTAAQA